MEKRELLIGAITQMLAPRLFVLCGDKPEEMGFPIYDTKEEVDDHLARQFDPVTYWTDKAREIAAAIVDTIDHGGTGDEFDGDRLIAKSAEFAAAWQPH
jgi:hypothetical protein